MASIYDDLGLYNTEDPNDPNKATFIPYLERTGYSRWGMPSWTQAVGNINVYNPSTQAQTIQPPVYEPAPTTQTTQPSVYEPAQISQTAQTTDQTTQGAGQTYQPTQQVYSGQDSNQTPTITQGQLTNLAQWLGPEAVKALGAGGVSLENVANLASTAWPVISSFLGENNNPALNYMGSQLTGLAGMGLNALGGIGSTAADALASGNIFGSGTFLDPTGLILNALMGDADPALKYAASSPMMLSGLLNTLGSIGNLTGLTGPGAAGFLGSVGLGALTPALSYLGPIGIVAAALVPMIQGLIDMDKPASTPGQLAQNADIAQNYTGRLNYFLGQQPGATEAETPLDIGAYDPNRNWMNWLMSTPEGRDAMDFQEFAYVPNTGISEASPQYKTLEEQLDDYNYKVWSALNAYQQGLTSQDPMKQAGWTGFLKPRMGAQYGYIDMGSGMPQELGIVPSGYTSQLWTPEEEMTAGIQSGNMTWLGIDSMGNYLPGMDPGSVQAAGGGMNGYNPLASVYDLYGNRSYNDYIDRWNAEHPDMQVQRAPKTGAELQMEYQNAVYGDLTPEQIASYGWYNPNTQIIWG